MPEMNSADLKSAVKEVIGACVSLGLKVEGRPPKEAMRELESGAWDSLLRGSAG